MRRLWIATGFIVSLLLGLQVSAAPQQVAEENWSILLDKSAQLALPVDAYEERLRMAREAVKSDSKRVAQVVKGWVAND